ncbi:peptidase M41 family [Synechococcus sp. A15-60]|nr:peptidase M41 family [Synechococcus sp. A15-60]
MSATTAGFAVAGCTGLAVFGPLVGLSPAWIALLIGGGLLGLTVDASQLEGMGGHLLAEALPGGRSRLRRVARHEAGHWLVAQQEELAVRRVLVGTRACLKAGLRCNGATEFDLPEQVRLPLEDLRRWSRVLQAGMVAEALLEGEARGGADDRALLGRIWGLSGQDVATAQREQRRARREVEQLLKKRLDELDGVAERLLEGLEPESA